MTAFQKVIKYLALAFAIFLIVNIISGILWGISGLAGILGLRKTNTQNLGKLEEITSNIECGDIATLKIELNYSNLTIQKGEIFKAESNSSDITCKQNNNQLIIKETSKDWFKNHQANDLIVYIPEDLNFDGINIKAGAGEVKIEELNTKDLYFEMGAGKVEIEKLIATNKAKIDGGAGQVIISSGEINDLDMDMGVGENIINSKLTGKAKINAGIGRVSVNLLDDISNYTIKVDKGLGSIKINGKEISDNTEYGDGENYIDIDGGIGEIEVKSK